MSGVMQYQVVTMSGPTDGPYAEGLVDTVSEAAPTPQPGLVVITGLDGLVDPSLVHHTANDITYDNQNYPTTEAALNYLMEEVQVLASEIPLPATEVTYDNPSFPTVEDALNYLLYVPIQLTFSNDQNILEIGQTTTEVTLNWVLNKAVTTQSLDNGIGTLAPSLRSHQVTFPSPGLSTNQSWTLTVGDGKKTASATTTVAFENKVYWGVSAQTSLVDADILALGHSAFATALQRSMAYDCSSTAYPYYCYPQAFGKPNNVTVGGFAFSDYTIMTQSFTNAHGHTSTYYVIRFNNIQTGPNITVSWA